MHGRRRSALAAALLAVGAVLSARAEAVETGQIVPDLTLRRIEGGSAPVVDRSSSATVLVFFRAPHERSAETLRMLGACAPRVSGKGVRFVGIVPADSASEAKVAVAASGAKLEGRCPDAARAYDGALKIDPEDAGANAGKKACGR